MIPNKHLLQNYKYVVKILMLKSIAFQPSNSHISTELLMRKLKLGFDTKLFSMRIGNVV